MVYSMCIYNYIFVRYIYIWIYTIYSITYNQKHTIYVCIYQKYCEFCGINYWGLGQKRDYSGMTMVTRDDRVFKSFVSEYQRNQRMNIDESNWKHWIWYNMEKLVYNGSTNMYISIVSIGDVQYFSPTHKRWNFWPLGGFPQSKLPLWGPHTIISLHLDTRYHEFVSL